MHIISRKRINQFIEKHPDSLNSLSLWFRLFRKNTYASLAQIKEHFPDADYVDGLIVFNISGNKYRLIAAIHFNRQKVYIRDILTHNAYDRNRWRQ